MRKFLALLLLIPAQLFAQGIDYTVTPTPVGAPLPLQNINQNQVGTPLNLGDDSSSAPINIGFDFTLYGQTFSSVYISNNGVIGLQSPINGCCSGYNLENGPNYGIYVFQTDLLNIGTTNPYYASFEDRFVVGWYNMALYGDGNSRGTYEVTLFSGSNDILLNYGDVNGGGRVYTSGIRGTGSEFEIIYYGSDRNYLDFTSWTLSPGTPPPPILFWDFIAGENQSFILYSETVVRYGANGTYATLVLQPGTYSCSNSLFGDPIGGVVKSCEIPGSEPVNCTSDPTNPSCALQAYTDPTTIATDAAEADIFAQETNAVTDFTEEVEVESGSTIEEIEEQIVAESIIDQEEMDYMEEMLASSEESANVSGETLLGESSTEEIEDEETAEKLADAIDPSLLNLVLSIVEQTSQVDNSGASAGAVIGGTSQTVSASGSFVADSSTQTTVRSSSQNEFSNDMSNNFGIDVAEDTQINNVIDSSFTADAAAINSDPTMQALEDLNTGAAMTLDSSSVAGIEADKEAMDIIANVTQNSVSAPTFDETENNEFAIMTFDPNNPANQFFNNMPSIANQEAAGVLNSRQEDKSDAEKRAEEVVAANQSEQEAINANYMDADQSGIVAAMGSDTDFTSYRSAMLQDASAWYKPEDIYKNVVIKDNVRGAYFLEKGSTDTYKKMVEEQYKDE